MTNWRISIHTVARARTPGPEVFFQRKFDMMVDIAVHVFVLHSDAGTVLVDTGLIEGYGELNGQMRSRKGPQAGFDVIASVNEIVETRPDRIALTSFGPYAAGGLPRLDSEIPLYCSARGLRDVQVPEEASLRHPLPEPVVARLGRAIGIENEKELMAGIRFIETGVHHPASAAIAVSTAVGDVIIADPVFVGENLTGAIALGAAEHVAGWHGMVRALAQEPVYFLPIHDPMPTLVRVEPGHQGHWRATIVPEMLEMIS